MGRKRAKRVVKRIVLREHNLEGCEPLSSEMPGGEGKGSFRDIAIRRVRLVNELRKFISEMRELDAAEFRLAPMEEVTSYMIRTPMITSREFESYHEQFFGYVEDLKKGFLAGERHTTHDFTQQRYPEDQREVDL